MNIHTISKLFIRYLVFVGIPFLMAKRIEKSFWKHADSKLQEETIKKLKELDEISGKMH